jgi:hypothetical protein
MGIYDLSKPYRLLGSARGFREFLECIHERLSGRGKAKVTSAVFSVSARSS